MAGSALGIAATIDGLKPLTMKLERMSRTVRNKIIRKAMRHAYKPVLVSARAKAVFTKGYSTGWLKKSLSVRHRTYRKSGTVMAFIGPRAKFIRTFQLRGKTVKRWATKYAHLAHNPTIRTAGVPFLKNAWNEQKGRVEAIMRAELWKGIQEEARKGVR